MSLQAMTNAIVGFFFVCVRIAYAVDMQYTFFVLYPAYKVYVVVFFFFLFHMLLIATISGLVTPFLREREKNTHAFQMVGD